MSTGWKFEVIHETLKKADNLLNVAMLCEIAGVSRSGYYRWVKAEGVRMGREEQDRLDFELIVRAYSQRGYSKGARGIYMCMLHWEPPVVMNLKKIRRLMDKYGLECPIRRAKSVPQDGKSVKNESYSRESPEPGIHGAWSKESPIDRYHIHPV